MPPHDETESMTANDQRDVVVVGGGVVGCATARALAPDHDVLLLERDQIAGGTTGRASGLITNPASHRHHPQLAAHATEFFRTYDGTGSFAFTDRESVELVPTGHEATAREQAADSVEAGFDTEFLGTAALSDRYPDVFDLDGYAGGVVFADTGWVDPHTYTQTLANDAADRGADLETGVTVERIESRDGEVTGVRTSQGAVHADHVVCAAGWSTRDLVADYVSLPTYPFRWQSATLDPGWEVGAEYPMGWDPSMALYWRPERNGDLHVGGGEYRIGTPGSIRTSVTDAFRRHVATTVPTRLRRFERARLVEGHTCPTGDATTPDTHPIVDAPADAPEGLVVATGFHVGGIMTSPAAATAVRSLVTGETAPFSLDSLALDRFDTRTPEFSFQPHMVDDGIPVEGSWTAD